MNFAILAPGVIAQTMAKTVIRMENVHCYAVASRTLEKAKNFAQQWGFEKAYGSYEEMLNDKQVELVYVCSPHSLHYQYAKMCLEHGKNVLVEKPFTVNEAQAADLFRIADEKGLLITEAMWTRYMPSRRQIDDVISSGMIGKVTSVTANLGYALEGVERMQKPELAGGALLDLGVYTVHFACMALKGKVVKITSDAVLSEAWIDLMNQITLTFEDNTFAILHSTMLANVNRMGLICGDKGYIEVQNINNCEEIRVYNGQHELISRIEVPEQITGFEYQVNACIRSIENHQTECEEHPHAEILRCMRIMDEARSQWGMSFPCESYPPTRAQIGEEEEILKLYQAAGKTPGCTWNEDYPGMQEIERDISTGNLWVIRKDARIIGAMSVESSNELNDLTCFSSKEGAFEIARVVIDEHFQGRGLAAGLLKEVFQLKKEQGLKAVHLLVSPGNQAAAKLYEKQGFVKCGETDRYEQHWNVLELVLDAND